jgi:hypothetical protein
MALMWHFAAAKKTAYFLKPQQNIPKHIVISRIITSKDVHILIHGTHDYVICKKDFRGVIKP